MELVHYFLQFLPGLLFQKIDVETSYRSSAFLSYARWDTDVTQKF